MTSVLIYPMGTTAACGYAAKELKLSGLPLTDHPSPEVTHLLLDVPSFGADGSLRGGGDVHSLLRMLPENCCVIGGNLNHPALAGKRCIDLLKAPMYLAKNAAITAECALQVAYPKMDFLFCGAPCLIIGWGRIGKCLGQLLKSVGADVTIAARKAPDRAICQALGYGAADTANLENSLDRYRLIFNTAPELVLNRQQMAGCHPDCVKIELASKAGMEDDGVIIARGLPGIHMPESSGKLIAETYIRLYKEELT